MTQRIFDTDNADDMALLWSILPDGIIKISPNNLAEETSLWSELNLFTLPIGLIKINWHDKTEITRPIQEATETDIGKMCKFWNEGVTYIGKLCHIKDTDTGKYYEMGAPVVGNFRFTHCCRLTKQEIEELC